MPSAVSALQSFTFAGGLLQMEMRHKFINRARNVWDRAVKLLPRIDQFWYKYSYMEEMVGNADAARGVFERWMSWEPAAHAWTSYARVRWPCVEWWWLPCSHNASCSSKCVRVKSTGHAPSTIDLLHATPRYVPCEPCGHVAPIHPGDTPRVAGDCCSKAHTSSTRNGSSGKANPRWRVLCSSAPSQSSQTTSATRSCTSSLRSSRSGARNTSARGSSTSMRCHS